MSCSVSNRFRFLVNHAKLDFKDYQFEGVKWCVGRETESDSSYKKGGIILDEMGLGKTFTMIATMYVNMLPSTLIVVPPILVKQWCQEIYKVSGHKALIYHGHNKKKLSLEQLVCSPIVITTYHAISISKKRPVLDKLHQVLWSRVIFDEAHHLRNRNTTRFLGCKHLKAGVRWFMTGTPIQNKRSDFYHLCNALGLEKSFYTDVENMPFILKTYVLRRTKQNAGIVLPDLIDTTIMVPWANERKVAEEIHSILTISGVSSKKGGILSRELQKGRALTTILRAKQICIMPSLLKPLFVSFFRKGILNDEYMRFLTSSSKLDAVVACIVEKKENGKGKIVFCHYHEEIDFIATQLRDYGLSVLVCDGRSRGVDKDKKVDVLILQIQTGCEGLNLQENYSEVYFVSPNWNPSIEDQAVARCHRMGQMNDVYVFRFMMDEFDRCDNKNTKTLEKYVYDIQEIKRRISIETLG